MLKYKAGEYGIDVIVDNESYTSKCSFIDKESVKYHNVYMGKRLTGEGHRGLFRSKNGILINSDTQGALNTMIKVIPNAFDKFKSHGEIVDSVLNPVSVNIKELLSCKAETMIQRLQTYE